MKTPAGRRRLAPFLALAMLSCLAPGAAAATRTWSGLGGDTNWTTAGNWDVLPVAGDDLAFPSGVPAGSLANNNNFPALTLFGSITFNGNGYTLNGNAITLGTGGIAGTSGAAPQTNDINLAITLSANTVIDVVNGGELHFNGAIGGNFNITKSGNGNIQFFGPNTYGGTTSVTGYLLVIGNATALGAGDGTPATGTTVANGTAIDIFSAITVANEALTLNGGGPGGPGALYSVASATWGGPINLATTSTIAPDSGTLTITGVISGVGGLTKGAPGTLLLTNNNTYLGPTVVNAGKLMIVIGSLPAGSPVTVNAGAELDIASSGTVGTVTSIGGSVFPGFGGSGIGNTGSLIFDAASTYKLALNATSPGSFSQLFVTGAVNLGGATLADVSGSGTSAGNAFPIIVNDGADPVVGTFAGLPEGATFVGNGRQFSITYAGGTGNDVVLTQLGAVSPTSTPTPTATTTTTTTPTPTPTGTVTAGVPATSTPTPTTTAGGPGGGGPSTPIPTLAPSLLALLAAAIAGAALLLLRKA